MTDNSAWQTLWERHGSLPWKSLFAPAINVARNGFPVNVDLAGFLANRTFILNDTNWRESYAPNGTIIGLGDTCYRRKLATTLEYIANNGADSFYTNSNISRNIVRKVQQTGGIMTEADLAGYTALVKAPTSITYR